MIFPPLRPQQRATAAATVAPHHPPSLPLKRPREESCEAVSATNQPSPSPPPTPLLLAVVPPTSFSFRLDILQHMTTLCEDALRRGLDPALRVPQFYCSTERLIVLYDCFPKGGHHLLMLPRITLHNSGSSKAPSASVRMRVTDLTTEDVPLLQEMQSVAEGIMKMMTASELDPTMKSDSNGSAVSNHTLLPQRRQSLWQVGFHVVPSLFHLHCHVLTTDWEVSDCWKTKKHYNSFATPYFVSLSDVLRAAQRATHKVISNHHHPPHTKPQDEEGDEGMKKPVPTGVSHDGSACPSSAAEGGTPPPPSTLTSSLPLPNNSNSALLLFPSLTVASFNKAYLDKEMECYWCGQPMKTVPAAKLHLRNCPRNPRHSSSSPSSPSIGSTPSTLSSSSSSTSQKKSNVVVL